MSSHYLRYPVCIRGISMFVTDWLSQVETVVDSYCISIVPPSKAKLSIWLWPKFFHHHEIVSIGYHHGEMFAQ